MSKLVKKPWGHESWIEDGTRTPYAVKNILFLAGNRTSLQVHKYKCETNCIIKGTGKLYRSKTIFDIDMFLEKGIETIDMMQIELELKEIKRQLREQAVFKVREELEEDLDIAS